MKRTLLILAIICVSIFSVDAQQPKKIPHTVKLYKGKGAQRTEIILPQVKGFNCYKGDFHIHTMYSDGNVTPAARVSEAWLDGLDIIAITDHYESRKGEKNFLKVIAPYSENGEPIPYQSVKDHKAVKADFNAIHAEAVAQLEKSKYPMLVIKGCEMARNAQSHGHFNCLFLKDANGLYDEDLSVAFRRVHAQGGIVVHNHPGWRRDTTDKTEFHEKVYGEGLIDGVEVVNGSNFYPHIVRRCIDEKLTMFADTDIHGISPYYRISPNTFRTMTFVLAKELTEKAVKDAILKHRTIAYSRNNLIGEEEWLAEFLNAAVECRMVQENVENGSRRYRLTNHSSIPYILRQGKKVQHLEPFSCILVEVVKEEKSKKHLAPTFSVDNMWHADYQHPVVTVEIDK